MGDKLRRVSSLLITTSDHTTEMFFSAQYIPVAKPCDLDVLQAQTVFFLVLQASLVIHGSDFRY